MMISKTTKKRGWLTALAGLTGLFLTISSHSQAMIFGYNPWYGQTALKDVHNRVLTPAYLQGRYLIVGFTDKEGAKDLMNWQIQVAYELGKATGWNGKIVNLILLDAHAYDRLKYEAMVQEVVKKWEKTAVNELERCFYADGAPVDTRATRGIHPIPMWDQRLTNRFFPGQSSLGARMALIGPDGRVLKILHHPSPFDAQAFAGLMVRQPSYQVSQL